MEYENFLEETALISKNIQTSEKRQNGIDSNFHDFEENTTSNVSVVAHLKSESAEKIQTTFWAQLKGEYIVYYKYCFTFIRVIMITYYYTFIMTTLNFCQSLILM